MTQGGITIGVLLELGLMLAPVQAADNGAASDCDAACDQTLVGNGLAMAEEQGLPEAEAIPPTPQAMAAPKIDYERAYRQLIEQMTKESLVSLGR